MKKRTTEFFIFIFTALAFSYFSTSEAGTCSSISRSSFGSNTILTSAELNSQFSTVYSATNDLDAGCLTDGTLEASALNTSDFQPILNNVVGGCLVSRSSVSAVSISPCSMSVNGNMVYKTGATVVSMGCGDCSAETASTTYYVYVKGDSTGTTLNAFLSTSAPDTLGNSGTARVIARIRNDSSSNIIEYGIDQWKVNSFEPTKLGWINGGTLTIGAVTTAPDKATTQVSDNISWTRNGAVANINISFVTSNSAGGTIGSGQYLFSLPSGLQFSDDVILTTADLSSADSRSYGSIAMYEYDAGGGAVFRYGEGKVIPYNRTQFRLHVGTSSESGGASYDDTYASHTHWRQDEAVRYYGSFSVPIDGFY
jgi:hypothetical protein